MGRFSRDEVSRARKRSAKTRRATRDHHENYVELDTFLNVVQNTDDIMFIPLHRFEILTFTRFTDGTIVTVL